MWSGCHTKFSPRFKSAPRRSVSRPPLRMYHWRLVTISSGRSPFSKNLTGCMMARGSPSIAPHSRNISTTLVCAWLMNKPAICSYAAIPLADSSPFGGVAMMRPSRPMMARVGKLSSRHQITSVRSPNVQIMAMPVPLSICASGCARTGTSTPYSGVRTVLPKSGL